MYEYIAMFLFGLAAGWSTALWWRWRELKAEWDKQDKEYYE